MQVSFCGINTFAKFYKPTSNDFTEVILLLDIVACITLFIEQLMIYYVCWRYTQLNIEYIETGAKYLTESDKNSSELSLSSSNDESQPFGSFY